MSLQQLLSLDTVIIFFSFKLVNVIKLDLKMSYAMFRLANANANINGLVADNALIVWMDILDFQCVQVISP